MFPEGTRRRKGMRKRYQARWHTGAARIALEAGVPLVPAGIDGTQRLGRFGPLRVAYGPPIEVGDLATLETGDAAQVATDRLREAITALERSVGSTPPGTHERSAPRDRRRLVRAPRVPRAAALDPPRERAPRQPPDGSHVDGPAALAGGAAAGRVRRLGHAHRADLPPRAARRLPGGPGVRPGAPGAARPRARASRGGRDRLREGGRLRGRRLPRGRGRLGTRVRRHRAGRDVRPRRVPARRRRRHDPPAGARGERARTDRARRGAGALRRRAVPGARLHRAARRPVRQDPRRARRGGEDRGVAPDRARQPRCAARRGRFSAEAEALRTYRHIATLDPSASIPSLPDREPDWAAAAAAADALGLGRLAGRLEEAASS